MAHILLAIYLLLIGLNILVGIDLPSWVIGTLAVAAGAMLLVERFGFGKRSK